MNVGRVDAEGPVYLTRLANEARYLAEHLFKVSIADHDAERYADAVTTLRIDARDTNGSYQRLLHLAMDEDADIEALEFALRLSARANPVTQRLQTLAFLIESEPQHHRLFLSRTDARLQAFAVLGLHTLRAALKLVRGRLLLRRLRKATRV